MTPRLYATIPQTIILTDKLTRSEKAFYMVCAFFADVNGEVNVPARTLAEAHKSTERTIRTLQSSLVRKGFASKRPANVPTWRNQRFTFRLFAAPS